MIEVVLPADIVAAAREARAAADAQEAYLLDLACQWADAHPPEDEDLYANFSDRGQDTGIAIAGQGAPLVAEFAVAEFASALRMSTEAGST